MAARAAGEEDRPGEKLRKVGEGRVENIGKISSQVMSFRLRFPSHPRPNASRYYYFLCRGSRFFLDIWASLPAKTMFRVRAAGDRPPPPLSLPFSGVVSLSAKKNTVSWKATFEKLSFLLLPASTIFTLTFGDVTRMFIDHIAINPNSGRGWVPRVTAQGVPFWGGGGGCPKEPKRKRDFFVAKLQRQREIKKYVNEWKSFVRKGEKNLGKGANGTEKFMIWCARSDSLRQKRENSRWVDGGWRQIFFSLSRWFGSLKSIGSMWGQFGRVLGVGSRRVCVCKIAMV